MTLKELKNKINTMGDLDDDTPIYFMDYKGDYSNIGNIEIKDSLPHYNYKNEIILSYD